MRRALILCLALACGGDADKPAALSQKQAPLPKTTEPPKAELSQTHAALAQTGQAFVARILELETTRDVTCWTSFRQLDNFISSKTYSDFATLTKIAAAKALAHAVWADASKRASGAQITVADVEAAFSVEADLPAAKQAELEKFAGELGMQQFRDYRTTSEHWRVLLAVAQDELANPQPTLKPLAKDAQDRLALATTKLSLALLTESGAIATEARTPFIEGEHVKKAYQNLLERHELPPAPERTAAPDHQKANVARIPLTRALIDAKIEALRHYNKSTDDIHQELGKISRVPIDQAATARLVKELMSAARFFAKGFEPMRADNYLADGNFAPKKLAPKPYVEPAHIENVTLQIWPYLMMPNGDVSMRFEPRPGHVSKRDLEGQDVTLLDHQMNAVRDTAIHWLILRMVWEKDPYAMDPFAAEYLSELVSIMATFYVRRAQTVARQSKSETVTEEAMSQVRDNGYVMVMPTEGEHATWGPEQLAAKDKALRKYKGKRFGDVTETWGLPIELDAVDAATPGSSDFDIQTVMGAGIAVGDVDDDGDPDLFFAGEGLGRLFLNQIDKGQRKFEDATEAWGIPGPLPDSRGPLFYDFDNDGDLDLLIVRSVQPSLLLEQQGGKFVRAAADRGLETGRGAHVATAFDADADGDLDLYVGYYGSAACNRGECPGRNLPSLDGRNGTPNQLFIYEGGRYTEAGASAGAADEGWTLAASSFDYDADGDADLYLANDFGANPLLRNNGDGTFTDVAAQLGAADRGSGMNVSFADLDGNGAFEVFVSNIDMFSKNIKVVFPTDESVVNLSDSIVRSFQYLSGNKLYFNVQAEGGGRRFEPREGLWFEPGDRGWGWAAVFFDYDLDGDEDMYLANGWIPGSPAADQPNQMFLRDGDVFYWADATDQPDSFAGNSRSAVALDVDLDGDLDLAVNNFAQAPRLLENLQRAGNAWLKVRLRGGGRITSRGVGAVLELTAGRSKMRRVVTAGNGYLGQEDGDVVFGLGRARRADLTVVWPDGTRQEVRGLRANARHEIAPPAAKPESK